MSVLSLGLIRLLQTFWGLAVVLGLGGYSLYRTVLPSDTNAANSSPSIVADAPLATPHPTAPPGGYPTPVGGYPTPSPLTVFLACNGQDGDAARYYVSAPSGFVVLRVDTDIVLVRALLAGETTRFGPGVNLVQTPCMRGLVRDGRVP